MNWKNTYNADGLRTQRTNGYTTYNYIYNGDKLSQMTVGEDVLRFGYSPSGVPLYVQWNDARYFYVTNIQGDVLAIISKSGNTVVEYTYDAWGNILTTTGSRADNLGKLNPLRYRGYVYDQETGLYYLQSRYYDPNIGRFLNSDIYPATGQGILGNNMFAYCLNNPVNFVDRNGKNAEALQWWSGGMWWICGADAVLPFGDMIYIGGIIVLGAVALATSQDSTPEITFDEADTTFGPPSPNNNNDDDDDDDDDYYENDDNFGGRQKIGKSKGGTPGNNQAQNRQFKDATRGIPKGKKRQIHDLITKQQYGYDDIAEIAKWFK